MFTSNVGAKVIGLKKSFIMGSPGFHNLNNDKRPEVPTRKKSVTFDLTKNKIHEIPARQKDEMGEVLTYHRCSGVRMHSPRNKPSFLRSIF